ncbi:MAG TPA: SIMPL domain-containing protein [Mycobacteriales bacterium]|nr:SIMPL domain-containing protein [Mycobacteriales bacterium]
MNESPLNPVTMLSVRGTAERIVAPDYAVLSGELVLRRGSKPEALDAAARELDSLTTALGRLGGVALDLNTGRVPLTWSARSVSTHAERDHDKRTGRYELTGTIIASVSLAITVRQLDLLGDIGSALAGQQQLELHQTRWGADEDNAGWPLVRAEAIRAALRKGRDYADALGGRVVEVQHIADVGLLSGDESLALRGPAPVEAASIGGTGDSPTLDPVPQTLRATIEARLLATGVAPG